MSKPAWTPSQTVGPYFAIGLSWAGGNQLAGDATAGESIRIDGRVLDGDGEPVPDAMLEIWHADSDGCYHTSREDGFCGAGRVACDSDGAYVFDTIMPGAVTDELGQHAPCIHLCVFARGLLTHLYTRVYFPQYVDLNSNDPLLQQVPRERQSTLIATRHDERYRFDIHLQGTAETVFLDV